MEILFLGILFIISGILFIQTLSYSVPSYDTSGGPALFPQYILILMMISIVVLIIQLLKNKSGKEFVFLNLFRGLRGMFLLTIVLYLIALKFFGFFIATAIFLVFTVNYLTNEYTSSIGTVKQVIIRSVFLVAFTAAIYFLFGDIFKIMLPKASLF